MSLLSPLTAVAPVDGRYWKTAGALAPFFSESALIRHRLEVETEYFLALLGELGIVVAEADVDFLRDGYRDWDEGQAQRIKDLEGRTAHDVKAVEYFLKDRIAKTRLGHEVEKAHLGLTSEDINNLAYARMHDRALREVLLPAFLRVVRPLADWVDRERQTPMLARTHGQPATPTTVGKELGVSLHRLCQVLDTLAATRLSGKLAGATGTYGALAFAYPGKDWPTFARTFVTRLGLRHNPVVTQIEPHDSLAVLYDTLRHAGNILIDLSQDMWQYISLGFFNQRVAAAEVGSSTMPHKVNPIAFENAEG
ncbi:MAG: adenylosuccinate lyase, partial [Cyanobacteria bacterium REEB65]|nr:adenylosuccinate lyase [Cyanobacteria bacterium REEB65]